jgi:hypothetical protein
MNISSPPHIQSIPSILIPPHSLQWGMRGDFSFYDLHKRVSRDALVCAEFSAPTPTHLPINIYRDVGGIYLLNADKRVSDLGLVCIQKN